MPGSEVKLRLSEPKPTCSYYAIEALSPFKMMVSTTNFPKAMSRCLLTRGKPDSLTSELSSFNPEGTLAFYPRVSDQVEAASLGAVPTGFLVSQGSSPGRKRFPQ